MAKKKKEFKLSSKTINDIRSIGSVDKTKVGHPQIVILKKYKDGRVFVYYPDGRKVIRMPDGTEIERNL